MAASSEAQQRLATLARQAANGDENAFNELYRLTRDRAYFVAFSITKNEDDAFDILQDSYLKAWGKLGSLESYAAVGAWLNQIVGNCSKDYVKKRRPQLFQPTDEDRDPLAWQPEKDGSYVPDTAMDTAETRRLIMGIVDDLPEDQRLCVLMRYYYDLDLREIAAALEVPYETVKSRLRYARRKISDGVEDLERKGTKLYGAAPVPLVAWFLKHGLAESGTKLPYAILAGTAAKTGGIIAALTLPKIVAGVSAAVIVAGGVTAATRLRPKPREDARAAFAVLSEAEATEPALPAAAHEAFAPRFPPLPAGGRSTSTTYARQNSFAAPAPYNTTRAFAASTPAPIQAATSPAPAKKTPATTKPVTTIAAYTAKTTTATATTATTKAATTTTTTTTATTTTTTTTTTTAVPYVSVTYNFARNGGGAATKTSDSVQRGATADLTPAAEKAGWNFLGWNTDGDAHEGLDALQVSDDTVLYAIYSKQIAATFHDYTYGGGNPAAYNSFSYGGSSSRLWRFNNEAATMATPALRPINGWTPMGWSTTGALGAEVEFLPGQAIHLTEGANFYGIYQRDITVTFDAQGGAPAPPDQSITLSYVSLMAGGSNIYPDITMPPAPSKAGAAFSGWLGGGVNYAAGASVKPVAVSYVAQWN